MCAADQNAPVEPEPPPEYYPASEVKSGTINRDDDRDHDVDEDSEVVTTNEPDSASRVEVLLTSSLCLVLLTLLI